MINSTFGGFMTARLGLSASQKGLEITGQNLTNSSTTGYTRQRIDQVSINYGGSYRYSSKFRTNIGNGVLVTGTSQLRDPFLDLRYRNEVTNASEQDIKLNVLNDLQKILDEVKNGSSDSLNSGGIFNQLGDILGKLQQLSNQVGNKEFDSMVKNSCQSLVTLFNSYDKRLDEVKTNLEYDMENIDVPRVNKILKSIQNLNQTIKSNEILGDNALELKDQRNLLLDELSEYMKINVHYKPVQVSDSTIVDELTVSIVGKDGKSISLIADEQCREFTLEKQTNGTWNVGLSALTPDDTELTCALKSAEAVLKQAKDTLANVKPNFEKAHNDLSEKLTQMDNLKGTLTTAEGEETAAKAKHEKAVAAYEAALKGTDADKKTQAYNEMKTATEEYVKAKNTLAKAKAAVDNYQKTFDTAKTAYEKAVEDLPTDPTALTLTDKNGHPITTNLLTKAALAGGNKAEERVTAATQARDDAEKKLNDSNVAGEKIDSINDALKNGKLKGALDMMNYSAEYDDPPNSIRGIGYFKSTLDTLANKFATIMNEANNPKGNPFTDAAGATVKHDLFKSRDGGKITAGSIALADGWVDNSYGITASKDKNMPEGDNSNILHFISLFNKKMQYTTDNGTLIFNGTFEESFTNIGVTLGLDIKSTSEHLDNYSKLVSSISENREAVTGVNLDEEAMNIMRYQQSYNASARLMTALDDMLSTLITNTGMVGR
nr:flagellar basal body rod C-terminal domain-containing protein [uncultured Anaerotignum sp.]